jgi:arginine decarboxylase (EC 4.1.1.19)
MNRQDRTPIYDALHQYIDNRIVSFDVPGHKQGKGHKALVDALARSASRWISIQVSHWTT